MNPKRVKVGVVDEDMIGGDLVLAGVVVDAANARTFDADDDSSSVADTLSFVREANIGDDDPVAVEVRRVCPNVDAKVIANAFRSEPLQETANVGTGFRIVPAVSVDEGRESHRTAVDDNGGVYCVSHSAKLVRERAPFESVKSYQQLGGGVLPGLSDASQTD